MGIFDMIVKKEPTIVKGKVEIIPFLIAAICLCCPNLLATGTTFFSKN